MSGPLLLRLVSLSISKHSREDKQLISKLTYKLSPLGLFGPGDKLIEGHTEAYCIAKMILLAGPLSREAVREPYKEEFELAEQLVDMDHTAGYSKLIQKRSGWRKQLEFFPDPPMPQDLLDFIESLLILDPEKRPAASEALRHPYLQSLATDGGVGN
jgi:serine/threonine protein kinase